MSPAGVSRHPRRFTWGGGYDQGVCDDGPPCSPGPTRGAMHNGDGRRSPPQIKSDTLGKTKPSAGRPCLRFRFVSYIPIILWICEENSEGKEGEEGKTYVFPSVFGQNWPIFNIISHF